MSIVCRPPTAEYSTSRSARTVSGITGGAGGWATTTPEAASKRIERRECIDATILQTIGFIRVHSWPDLSGPDFAKTHTGQIRFREVSPPHLRPSLDPARRAVTRFGIY